MAFTCSFASASVAPGRKRAIIALNSLPRSSSVVCAGVNAYGTQSWVLLSGEMNPGGMTPMTRRLPPFTGTSRPMIAGSAP